MSEEKRIKELQKDLCNISSMCSAEDYDDCVARDGSCAKCRNIARNLYNMNYCKQGEVVEEVFAEIKRHMRHSFGEYPWESILEIDEDVFNELRRKCMEDGNEI